jgi:hypothetical protein
MIVKTSKKAGREKPSSITRNSSTSGETLTWGLRKWRMRGKGWLG